MKLNDFDYHISLEKVAQYPLSDRDSSRLFIIHRKANKFEHSTFRDIVNYLREGDVLVLNDTKVIPARLFGKKPTGGKVEIMLLKEVGVNIWEALVRGAEGGEVILSDAITARVSRKNGKTAQVKFDFLPHPSIPPDQGRGIYSDSTVPDIKSFLYEIGVMPLPPYIKRDSARSDIEYYQTIYANKEGAVAAPTAGLHFTDRLLKAIKEKGVNITTVTLHVGYGTFKPVTVSDITDHRMNEEFYEVPEAAAYAINSAKSEGRRVIAVGTTVTRTLESAVSMDKLKNGGKHGSKNQGYNHLISGAGEASIFIYPGYQFRIIDALITNFHQPRSTPMMLTSAFAGLDLLKEAYSGAQKEGYRFFSYGDSMFIM